LPLEVLLLNGVFDSKAAGSLFSLFLISIFLHSP
jgi:hypothetical protein